jgi:hypothetical protein
MRRWFFLFLMGIHGILWSQNLDVTKRIAVLDTLQLETVSINSAQFSVTDFLGATIDPKHYTIDYGKALLIFSKSVPTDSVQINYRKYPNFLTQSYRNLDPSLIQPENGYRKQYQSLVSLPPKNPFSGLSTSGSLSRGLQIGNSQNAVLNSELDLQISGKISDKVTLRASINDANIPIQNNGYSQQLDAFDNVFIELESDRWKLRAGDVDLANDTSYFLGFQKKIQGIDLKASLPNDKSSFEIAGALVRGQFHSNEIVPQEGNQGPYKLTGPSNELFLLIVSGSERIYANGRLLERGEDKDYIMDYNAGELLFSSKFPITANTRILAEFQYTENNYTRFIVYGTGAHVEEKFSISAYAYSEKDAKNQSLQQPLTDNQKTALSEAGDDLNLQTIDASVPAPYSNNRVLYSKAIVNNQSVYVYSNDENENLFEVRFQWVGAQQGNYQQRTDTAAGRIFEYVAPINGIPQGDFSPNIPLVTPKLHEILGVKAAFHPTEKTFVELELSSSNYDQNLFSQKDNQDNKGWAGHFNFNQKISLKNWDTKVFGFYDYVEQNYTNLEGLYQVEFLRDWNLPETIFGNQQLIHSGFSLEHPKTGSLQYGFEYLNYQGKYKGNRHLLTTDLLFGNLNVKSTVSALKNDALQNSGDFIRFNTALKYTFSNGWAGMELDAEKNKEEQSETQLLSPRSHAMTNQSVFIGVGNKEKRFAEFDFSTQSNDSVVDNRLQKVNRSKTFSLDSKLLQNKNSSLAFYANYRVLDSENGSEKLKSLNSKITYHQKLWENGVVLHTAYETASGNNAQQEWAYIKVEPGQGTHTWNDYNEDGIQTLDEFERALFVDEGNYLRIILPNQRYIRTHRTHLSQSLTLNPSGWKNALGIKKFFSKFYNQTTYLIERDVERNPNSFDLNPFESSDKNLLELQKNIRNSLWFNRGKQYHTTVYTYQKTDAQRLFWFGKQLQKIASHEILWTHKIQSFWMLSLKGILSSSENKSENYTHRNYNLNNHLISPTVSYIISTNARCNLSYQWQHKENTVNAKESLIQQTLKSSFSLSKQQKYALSGSFSYIRNNYQGNAFSAVGYQLLEGLQPGENQTWELSIQKQISKFLDLNLSYQGRKSPGVKSIHTGSIQLKAFF